MLDGFYGFDDKGNALVQTRDGAIFPLHKLRYEDGTPGLTWSSLGGLLAISPDIDPDIKRALMFDRLDNPECYDQPVNSVSSKHPLRCTPGLMERVVQTAIEHPDLAYNWAKPFVEDEDYQANQLEHQEENERLFNQFINGLPDQPDEPSPEAEQPESGDDDEDNEQEQPDDVPPPATDSGWKSRTTSEGSYYHHPDGWVTEWHRNPFVARKALERGEVFRIEVETETEDS
jgi:hypothetical protein